MCSGYQPISIIPTGPSTGISLTNVAHCLNKLQACLKEASEDVAGMVHNRGYNESHNVYSIVLSEHFSTKIAQEYSLPIASQVG